MPFIPHSLIARNPYFCDKCIRPIGTDGLIISPVMQVVKGKKVLTPGKYLCGFHKKQEEKASEISNVT